MKHNVKLFFSDKYEDITDLFYAKRKELGGQTKSGHPPPYLNNGKFKPYKNEIVLSPDKTYNVAMWVNESTDDDGNVKRDCNISFEEVEDKGDSQGTNNYPKKQPNKSNQYDQGKDESIFGGNNTNEVPF